MQHHTMSTRYYWLTLSALLVMAAAFVGYLRAEEEIGTAYRARYESWSLTDELRQSSDDLTRMARSNVATGEERYRRYFRDVLRIRNGTMPRPADATDVYWDLVLAEGRPPQSSEPAASLLQRVRQAGFAPPEVKLLREAIAASDRLTSLEEKWMQQVEGIPANDPLRLSLLGLLNSHDYLEAKAQVMRPISHVHRLVEARTEAAVQRAKQHARETRVLMGLVGASLMLLPWLLLMSIQRARRTKAESDALFRVVFETAAVGMSHVSLAGKFLQVNEQFCRIVGYARDELLGPHFTFQHLTLDEDRPAGAAAVQALLRGEPCPTPLSKRYVRKDGKVVWVDIFIYLLRDARGQPHSFIAVTIDTSEQKRQDAELSLHRRHLERLVAERTAALRQSEGKFRFIAENTGDVIWTVDLNSHAFTYVSPSVVRLFGYTQEEITGQRFESVVKPASVERMRHAVSDFVTRWKAGERATVPTLIESEERSRDGRIISTETLTTLHSDASGNLTSVLGVTRDVSERKRAEQALRRLALHDGLTQLPNRRLLLDRLQQAVEMAKRSDLRVGLLYMDLNDFKPVNDTLGHEIGDWLLQAVAKRIVDCLRTSDTAARVGGDEFVILVANMTDPRDIEALAERIAVTIAQPFVTPEGHRLDISASVGVAIFPDQTDDGSLLLRLADEAMYRHKHASCSRATQMRRTTH
jgi:diguanylate cyclase (GGDEF)-like protein/PAS domain S-box-containing protein